MKVALLSPEWFMYETMMHSDYCMVVPENSKYLVQMAKHYQKIRGRYLIFSCRGRNITKFSLQDLAEIIDKVQPDEIILPNCFSDSEQTVEFSKLGIKTFRDSGYLGKFMAVPQGRNLNEYLQCLDDILSISEIDVIGIDRNISVTNTPTSRKAFVTAIYASGLVARSVEWHLIGLNETFNGLAQMVRQHPWLRSISTGYPVFAAVEGFDVSDKEKPLRLLSTKNPNLSVSQKDFCTTRALLTKNARSFLNSARGII